MRLFLAHVLMAPLFIGSLQGQEMTPHRTDGVKGIIPQLRRLGVRRMPTSTLLYRRSRTKFTTGVVSHTLSLSASRSRPEGTRFRSTSNRSSPMAVERSSTNSCRSARFTGLFGSARAGSRIWATIPGWGLAPSVRRITLSTWTMMTL